MFNFFSKNLYQRRKAINLFAFLFAPLFAQLGLGVVEEGAGTNDTEKKYKEVLETIQKSVKDTIDKLAGNVYTTKQADEKLKEISDQINAKVKAEDFAALKESLTAITKQFNEQNEVIARQGNIINELQAKGNSNKANDGRPLYFVDALKN